MLAHILPQSTFIQNLETPLHLHSFNLANILIIRSGFYANYYIFLYKRETIPSPIVHR